MKKGQITVFIILGILIIIVLTALYLGIKPKTAPKAGQSAITDYVVSCLQRVAIEGVYLMSSQGGYLNPKGDANYAEEGDGLPVHYHLEGKILPYVLDGQEIRMRKLPSSTLLLNNYIVMELPKCLGTEVQGYKITLPELNWQTINFDFSQARVGYSSEAVRVTVISRENDVAIVANYPVKFSRGEESFTLTDFYTTVPLRLTLVEATAEKLIRNIANAHANLTAYNLFMHCEEYKSNDNLMNIYSTLNPYAANHAVSIVDAMPVKYGLTPLRYQFAMRNVLFGGMCVG